VNEEALAHWRLLPQKKKRKEKKNKESENIHPKISEQW
jgi:hypothetical protein